MCGEKCGCYVVWKPREEREGRGGRHGGRAALDRACCVAADPAKISHPYKMLPWFQDQQSMSTLGMDIRSADPDQKLIYLAHSSSLVPQVYDTHLASGSSGGLGVLSDVGSIIVCDGESTPKPAPSCPYRAACCSSRNKTRPSLLPPPRLALLPQPISQITDRPNPISSACSLTWRPAVTTAVCREANVQLVEHSILEVGILYD